MKESHSVNSRRFQPSNQISKSFIQSYHNKRIYNERIQIQPINLFQQLQKRLTIIPPANTTNIDLNISVTIYTQNMKREKQNKQYSKPFVKFNYLNASPTERVTHLQDIAHKNIYVSVIDDLNGLVHDQREEKITEKIEKKCYSIESEKLQPENIVNSHRFEDYGSLEIKEHNSQDRRFDVIKQHIKNDSHNQLNIKKIDTLINTVHNKPLQVTYSNSLKQFQKVDQKKSNIRYDHIIENRQNKSRGQQKQSHSDELSNNKDHNILSKNQSQEISRTDSKEKSLIHILQNQSSKNQIINVIPEVIEFNTPQSPVKPKIYQTPNTNTIEPKVQQPIKYIDNQSIVRSKIQQGLDYLKSPISNDKLNESSFRKRKKIFNSQQRKQIISKSNPKECIFKLSEDIKYEYSKKIEKIKVPEFIIDSWFPHK